MDTGDTHTALRRMEAEQQRLRRQVRGLSILLISSLALLLAGEWLRWKSSSGAHGEKPSELRVSRLIIQDEQGRVRGELGLMPGAQEPSLVFYHPQGQRWASLAVATPPGAPPAHQSASLTLHDESGKARILLGASGRDNGLVLYESEGHPGLALYLDTDSQGLVIRGSDAPRIQLRYTEHDDARLSELIFRDAQRTQAALQGGSGGGALNIYRPDGESAFRTP
ncbi:MULTISPECIES: hypothetical protein [unclassified Corallococcus]|uniref:hypothetical protein n=1 Tax=unclassified Corallococcus TaxID=2685029 RepID=UPI001A8D517E|nr:MULTISPECIES: hypothetical protein [unclassified Corallococcus]MBN9687737.1 hypothetical protein [Corallococcus sp. NCSPR001]WAS88450.1 hypothetical protein O0N60_16030 [Corallococcus sp. NCRR]